MKYAKAVLTLLRRNGALAVSAQILDEAGRVLRSSRHEAVTDLRARRDAIAFLPVFGERVLAYGVVNAYRLDGEWFLQTHLPGFRLKVAPINDPALLARAEDWRTAPLSRTQRDELDLRIEETGEQFKAQRVARWRTGVAERRAARAARKRDKS